MKNLKYILLGLAIILFLLIGFFGGRSYQKQLPSESSKYLTTQIELLQKELDSYKTQCADLEETRNQLENRIGKFESTIRDIQKSYNEKVVDITTYTNPELERFFTDRYGK